MVNCSFSYPDKLLSIENTLHMSVYDGQFSLHPISDDYICVCPSLPFVTSFHSFKETERCSYCFKNLVPI